MAKRIARQPLQDRLSRSFRRIPAEDVPRVYRIGLAEIDLNPGQPRQHFDRQALEELAASIERHGLIQPITVKPIEGAERYLLVAGERRYRAHQMLGRDEILAIVTTGDPDEISLIENIQRENLHPLEEAAAYARMMAIHGWTQEQVAEVVGKARPTITNILKLNDLPDAIRAEAAQLAEVSKSLLFEIARLGDAGEQLELWREVRGGATVRSVRSRKTAGAATGGGETVASTVALGRRFLERLEGIPAGDPSHVGAYREELARLRQGIDAALGRLLDAS
jgi:ParB family chromosome partitioning protein